MAYKLVKFYSAVLLLAMAAVAFPTQARGIVVSDNPNDPNHLVTAPSNYDMVGYINLVGGATGSLINPWYVLTAKHVVHYTIAGGSFRLDTAGGPQYYGIAEKWESPSTDLAVVRLTRSTNLSGYGIYTGSGEIGAEGKVVGYGMSGTPATVGAGGDPNYPRGTKRVGYNLIEYTPYYGYLMMDFDDPNTYGLPGGSLGANKEVMFALGDSGGPTFITVGGSLRIAGVHVSLPYNDPNHWPNYGDVGYDIRVSTYKTWILGLIPSQPATVTGDFNNDGVTNAQDINNLFAHYNQGDMWFDMTGDSIVGAADTDNLLHNVLGTEYGDATLDGKVDANDYQVLVVNFDKSGTFGWADGDFNGDGKVDFADYQILEAAYGFDVPGGLSAPPVPVPEPASLMLILAGGSAFLLKRRR